MPWGRECQRETSRPSLSADNEDIVVVVVDVVVVGDGGVVVVPVSFM